MQNLVIILVVALSWSIHLLKENQMLYMLGIQQTQATLSQEAVAKLPQYKTLQRNVQRKRKVQWAPAVNPGAVADIDIPDKLRTSLRGDNFLLHDSGAHDQERFFIFGTNPLHVRLLKIYALNTPALLGTRSVWIRSLFYALS